MQDSISLETPEVALSAPDLPRQNYQHQCPVFNQDRSKISGGLQSIVQAVS